MKRAVLFVVCLYLTAVLQAQAGLDIIRDAMRRTAEWENVGTVNYTSLQISFNKWQSYDYYRPSGNKNVLQFSYDLLNSRYFFTTDSYFGGGYHFSYANIGKDSVRYAFDRNGSRDGRRLSRQGKAPFIAGASFLQQFIPYYLLKNLAARKDSVYVVKDGESMIVRTSLKHGGYESYYFNRALQLFRQVSVKGKEQTERVFKSYTSEGGLTYASIIDNYVNGVLLTHDSLYNVTTVGLPESKLQLPAGYTMDTSSAQPKVIKLAGRVYLIENVPGGRNMMFVALSEGVFVTEAPLSTDVSQAMIDLIHKTLPGRPIKYLHLSHFHNDHTSGVRAFAAEGATVVATEYTLEIMRTILEDSTGRFKDRFEAMNTKAELQSLATFHQKAGRGIIELHEMQNGHVKGLSFVYLPAEKIIYEGDLYSLPSDGTITPAIEITRQFYAWLKKQNITPSRIIGHHGSSNITLAILKSAVRTKQK